MKNATLFDNTPRLSMHDSIKLTAESLRAYGALHRHWAIAWSGGKDSTATVTLIAWMIESGMIPAPDSLRVYFADTRMELTPIYLSATGIMHDLRERGIQVEVITAPIEKRFLPYILGRGVPPPNNNTFRWCTRQIKVEPMKNALIAERERLGQKFLTITGVRQGESAMRDKRIIMSCSRDGAECGQGWYQQTMPEAVTDTLAPLLHWRVCHVWEWLKHWAPTAQFGDWNTRILADAYGGDEAEEINARTGCVCCPLASNDRALNHILTLPQWAYLAPLKQLRNIYTELRSPTRRHRQTGHQRNADGAMPANPQRMGALTIAARRWAFSEIIQIQETVNCNAARLSRPTIDILNPEEIEYIRTAWANRLYPNGWTGDEPTADQPFDRIYPDGTIQPLLFQAMQF